METRVILERKKYISVYVLLKRALEKNIFQCILRFSVVFKVFLYLLPKTHFQSNFVVILL